MSCNFWPQESIHHQCARYPGSRNYCHARPQALAGGPWGCGATRRRSVRSTARQPGNLRFEARRTADKLSVSSEGRQDSCRIMKMGVCPSAGKSCRMSCKSKSKGGRLRVAMCTKNEKFRTNLKSRFSICRVARYVGHVDLGVEEAPRAHFECSPPRLEPQPFFMTANTPKLRHTILTV